MLYHDVVCCALFRPTRQTRSRRHVNVTWVWRSLRQEWAGSHDATLRCRKSYIFWFRCSFLDYSTPESKSNPPRQPFKILTPSTPIRHDVPTHVDHSLFYSANLITTSFVVSPLLRDLPRRLDSRHRLLHVVGLILIPPLLPCSHIPSSRLSSSFSSSVFSAPLLSSLASPSPFTPGKTQQSHYDYTPNTRFKRDVNISRPPVAVHFVFWTRSLTCSQHDKQNHRLCVIVA